MENKPYTNVFQDVHKKIQAKKDGARKASEERTGIRQKDAEKEAAREGFDRASTDTRAFKE
jgi:hypothetical protein